MTDIEIDKGSGNVYADLKVPDTPEAGMIDEPAPMTEQERLAAINKMRDELKAAVSAATRPADDLVRQLVQALAAVEGAMLMGGDGVVGDFGWSISLLTKARPAIRKALTAARAAGYGGDHG